MVCNLSIARTHATYTTNQLPRIKSSVASSRNKIIHASCPPTVPCRKGYRRVSGIHVAAQFDRHLQLVSGLEVDKVLLLRELAGINALDELRLAI